MSDEDAPAATGRMPQDKLLHSTQRVPIDIHDMVVPSCTNHTSQHLDMALNQPTQVSINTSTRPVCHAPAHTSYSAITPLRPQAQTLGWKLGAVDVHDKRVVHPGPAHRISKTNR